MVNSDIIVTNSLFCMLCFVRELSRTLFPEREISLVRVDEILLRH